MNGGQVGVLEERYEICYSRSKLEDQTLEKTITTFTSLLQGKHSRRLETEISLEVLGDLTDEPLVMCI
jgi:hypothetical protein